MVLRDGGSGAGGGGDGGRAAGANAIGKISLLREGPSGEGVGGEGVGGEGVGLFSCPLRSLFSSKGRPFSLLFSWRGPSPLSSLLY